MLIRIFAICNGLVAVLARHVRASGESNRSGIPSACTEVSYLIEAAESARATGADVTDARAPFFEVRPFDLLNFVLAG